MRAELLRQACQSGAPDQSLVPRCVCAPVQVRISACISMHGLKHSYVRVCARVRVCQQVSKKKAQTHLGRAQGGSPQDEEDFGVFEFDSEHARGVFLSEWAASKERGATLMADCGGHIFFGFEFTTKQMAKAVSKLHLSINKDSSNETIKRLVGFSPRVCIPLSGVAFVCFHRVCDFCRAARLPLVETSSCHGVTRRFLV